jgi:hypothetical protein
MMTISRTVGRNRTGIVLMAGLVGTIVILGVLASPGGASPRSDDAPATDELRRIGMNSCAARGCHGAVDAVDLSKGEVYIKDGAYTTWLNFDPHAGAYDVLLDARSKAIADKLKKPLDGKPAHEAALCLSCHATVSPPDPIRPDLAPYRDGISCEACHGPAEKWQDKHLDPGWRALPASAKARDGLIDLSTPGTRAKTCVDCHVGNRSRGMDMNHDLIAAGHPRLNFEFASYQASYPKHWKEKTVAADFEVKSWAVGQVATARAALDLLAGRALASKEGAARKAPAPEAVWPEFSEYECFSCHHGLTSPSPLQVQGHNLGRLPWATWPLAMLPELARGRPGIDLAAADSPLAELRAEMARPMPDPDRVADLAARAARQLDALRIAQEQYQVGADRVAALLMDRASRPPTADKGWDLLAQHDLALSSLARAARQLGVTVGPEVEEALRAASKLLEFPPDYDSPRNVSKPKSKP